MMLLVTVLLGIIPMLIKAEASQQFINEIVDRHNYYRAEYGAAPVVANETLNNYAQSWADYYELQDQTITPPAQMPYGEIDAPLKGTVNGTKHVDNLIKYQAYGYKSDGYCGSEPPADRAGYYGYFTQIVWKNTKAIGVGLAASFVVINYHPAGNVPGMYATNVEC